MDVTGSTVQLNTSDGKMDAYVAQPKNGGNFPGVVVIQEAFGVIADGRPKLLEFGITNQMAWEVGLACGGRVEIFVERIE